MRRRSHRAHGRPPTRRRRRAIGGGGTGKSTSFGVVYQPPRTPPRLAVARTSELRRGITCPSLPCINVTCFWQRLVLAKVFMCRQHLINFLYDFHSSPWEQSVSFCARHPTREKACCMATTTSVTQCGHDVVRLQTSTDYTWTASRSPFHSPYGYCNTVYGIRGCDTQARHRRE